MYYVSLWLRIETGLISMDQEKDFDRVEHQYLWQTLEAFGFNPGFIFMIRYVVLNCNIHVFTCTYILHVSLKRPANADYVTFSNIQETF